MASYLLLAARRVSQHTEGDGVFVDVPPVASVVGLIQTSHVDYYCHRLGDLSLVKGDSTTQSPHVDSGYQAAASLVLVWRYKGQWL